ncbi:MAG: hypothetical protein QNK03_12205 [Myxococcota bacterium]|nr:hypothetical protein [Myxococcota bacterium]
MALVLVKLRAIDHVTLYVRSLDAVRSYYEEVFGLSGSELRDAGARGLALENEAVLRARRSRRPARPSG